MTRQEFIKFHLHRFPELMHSNTSIGSFEVSTGDRFVCGEPAFVDPFVEGFYRGFLSTMTLRTSD